MYVVRVPQRVQTIGVCDASISRFVPAGSKSVPWHDGQSATMLCNSTFNEAPASNSPATTVVLLKLRV